MPTTLGTISNTAIKVRWREPYASESLNRKFTGIIPPGVYRGLVLGTSATALAVDVSPDATTGDHVALFESETGFTTTYTDDTSGTTTLSLSSFATNDVVVIAIFVDYTVGASSSAEFRGYTLAEYEALTAAARRALIVLGTVLRPAAGAIPSANITHDRRTLPFLSRHDQVVPWNPLLRNGGFELGETNGTYRHSSPFWRTSVSNGNFVVRPVTTEARTGFKSLELTTSVAGTVTATIQQDLWLPVVAGRYVMGTLYKKALQAATSSPSGTFRFVFGDQNGTNDVNEDLVFDVDAVDASFVDLTGIIQVPAGATILKYVQIIVVGTYAAPAPCIRFDDVKAWAQVTGGDWLDVRDSRSSEVAVGDLFVGEANSYANNSAKLSFSGSLLILDRRDENLSQAPPAISIQARTTGGIEYTLLFQSIPASGHGYRKYMSSTGRMCDVVNASYDNATNLWTKDVNGAPAYKQEARDTGFSSFSRVSDTAWSDASWIQHIQTSNPEITTFANQKFAPLLMLRDAAGNRRVGFDHLGLRGGRVTVVHQNWMAPMAAAWSSLATGTGSETILDDDPNIEGRAQRQFVNANGDRAGANAGTVFRPPLINQIHIVEYELSCSDLAGTPDLQWQGGFMHDEGGDPSSDNYTKISKTSASPNWFLNTQGFGTGAGSSDTGVAAGGLQKFRLEYYGSGVPGGARALCYINGSLVAERTSNLMDDSQSVALSFAFKATGVISNKQVILSPVTYTVARYPSDDAL